jgi:hypothetical protein
VLRPCALAFALVVVLATDASAIVVLYLDEIDDVRIVNAVANAEKVQASRKQLQELRDQLLKLKRPGLEALLGKPAPKPAKTYALPVAEARGVALPGLRDAADNRPDKDFVSFHPVGEFGAVEVYYSRHNQAGDTPLAVRFYLKVDKAFPKLTKNNLEERLRWEQGRLQKVAEQIGKGKQARLGPADVWRGPGPFVFHRGGDCWPNGQGDVATS